MAICRTCCKGLGKARIMIFLRSLLFQLAFYINITLRMTLLSPIYFLAPRSFRIPKGWASSSNWLMKKIVGATFEIEGLENLPKGPAIIAPKHQSAWDTFMLLPWMHDPVYILKRELFWLPLFGWYMKKQRLIPVNRAAKGRAMADVLKRTSVELSTGRQLIIYPEGTRRPPGAEPIYKNGIARLYRALHVPVVPIVMHPGFFWPKNAWSRYPGHFKVRVLPPIEPGLSQDAFLQKLISTMEKASDELLIETVAANPHLTLPESAVKRLAELKLAADAKAAE